MLTNANLNNNEANRIASIAENAFSTVIRPYNLSLDGDTVLTMATNEVDVDTDEVAILTYNSAIKSVLSIFRGDN